jgi:uncharacterized membrane protein
MFSKIRANFFTGLLIVIPAVLTLWVLYFIVGRLNLLLLEPIMTILEKWVPAQNLELLTKIAILFLLLIFLVLVGFATRIIILRNIFGFGEKVLYKVPMISTIYKTIKEISSAFFVQKDTIFKKVVLIQYPRKGLYSVGFVTSETKGPVQEKTGQDVMNIFVPSTPNPTTGMLVLVPRQEIIELDIPVSEGVKMILSGGAVNPQKAYNGNSEDRSNTLKKEGPKGD